MYVYILFFYFFFSSRRRHTRFDCDWSSDVCSSDLLDPAIFLELKKTLLQLQKNRRVQASAKKPQKKGPAKTAADRQVHRNRRTVARQRPRENLASQRGQPHRPRRARRRSRVVHRNQNGAIRPHPSRKRRRRNPARKKPHEKPEKLQNPNTRLKKRKHRSPQKRLRLMQKSAAHHQKYHLHRHGRLPFLRQLRHPNQRLPVLFQPASEPRL